MPRDKGNGERGVHRYGFLERTAHRLKGCLNTTDGKVAFEPEDAESLQTESHKESQNGRKFSRHSTLWRRDMQRDTDG